MPRVALWFFAMAPIYVLIGMGFGIYMGATMNFTLAPAHAHLNLIGWVTMALYGTFFALAPTASRKLAWTVFWLNNIAICVMFPSLSMLLLHGDGTAFVVPLVLSEFTAAAGMVCFIAAVWGVLLKSGETRSGALQARPSPAE